MTMGTRTPTNVFDSVVCGIDRSEAGIAAARAAALVASPEGRLLLVAVDDPSAAVHAGWAMPQILDELAAEARGALERGRAEAEPLHRPESTLVKGDPRQVLLAQIARRNATLVAVGSHGTSRAAGIALGAVSTHLLHEAPCAVLVARPPVDVGDWPRSMVVGVDGSASSGRALDAARALGERFERDVRVIVATDDSHVDLEAARAMAPELEEHDARAIDALRVAAETADLVVVGSRGLRGLRALGSLSERLAHDARHSVLVVRP